MEYISCKIRNKNLTSSNKSMRRSGSIPGVLYGKGIENLLFEVGEMEFNKEIKKIGGHGVLNLNIDGEVHKGLIKEIQRDAINHNIIHVDLEELQENRMISTDIPILFEGEDFVNSSGGIIQKQRNSVRVNCKGGEIPKSVKVNLSSLKIGDSYRVADMEIAKEITIDEDPNTIIAAITKANTKILDETDESDTVIKVYKSDSTEENFKE